MLRHLAAGLGALAIALACAPGPSLAGASPLSLPLLHRSSLTYAGAFRLPPAQGDRKTFDYGGTALAYDPGRNGLFAVGHDWYQLTAEVSIPRLGSGRRIARLPRARYLQPFADATGGIGENTGGDSINGVKVGGQLVYGGRLYGSDYIYYDATDSQLRSLWARSSTSLRAGLVAGLFRVGRQEAGLVSGYMALVPPEWRGLLGGPALAGNCCIPIISRTSFGPAAFTFDPAQAGRARPIPDHPLVYYPADHPTLGAWDSSWNRRRGDIFTGTTSIRGVVFPAGSRSDLFFGTQGLGKFCYGDPTDDPSLAFKPSPDGTIWCYDPNGGGKGPHAYPYVPEVWAYDAAPLAAVRAGRRRPWQVRPYATWSLPLRFGSPQVGGVAYDPARRLVYVSEQYADGPAPVIIAFRLR